MNDSKETKMLRANLLGGMDSYIKNVVGDEEIWGAWIELGVPDECDEETLMEIAEDESEFIRITEVFGSLIRDDFNLRWLRKGE